MLNSQLSYNETVASVDGMCILLAYRLSVLFTLYHHYSQSDDTAHVTCCDKRDCDCFLWRHVTGCLKA